jgi:hypothetical protein
MQPLVHCRALRPYYPRVGCKKVLRNVFLVGLRTRCSGKSQGEDRNSGRDEQEHGGAIGESKQQDPGPDMVGGSTPHGAAAYTKGMATLLLCACIWGSYGPVFKTLYLLAL